jgi:hypothetical protein
MNKLHTSTLALVLLTTSLSLHTFITPTKPFPQEDDMTSFDDLASAGHHLCKKIQEERERAHEIRIARLVSNYQSFHRFYVKAFNVYEEERKAQWVGEAREYLEISKTRANSQWRDYIVMATGIGTFLAAVGILTELVQHNTPATLGCTALTAGGLWAYGISATWAENARFQAARELEKQYSEQNKSLRENFEISTEEKNKAERYLIQAYLLLQNAKPRTPEAKKIALTVELPKLTSYQV